MRNLKFATALSILTICLTFFSCVKKEETTTTLPTEQVTPGIPEGNRIRIHFGTSTQNGCLYSFTNCIWIGWGESLNNNSALSVRFNNANNVESYFGDYFPLTADFTIDDATAESMGLQAGVVPAGFYPISDTPIGKMVSFAPSAAQPVAALVNPKNPQDNLGQLHNLALQVILSPENKATIRRMEGNKTAIQQFVKEQTFLFLESNELPVSQTEQAYINQLDLYRDYSNYSARIDEMHLSANDQKVLRGVFEDAAAITIQSSNDLSKFVDAMTILEKDLASNNQLDNPKAVLSTVSVLKYSRYYWYWKSIGAGGTGTPEPAQIPDWVWADAIGLELGGPAGSIIASAIVYMDTH